MNLTSLNEKQTLGIGFILIVVVFSLVVFTHPAFLQQEIVGMAYEYTKEDQSFLYTLFDPYINDQAPGRFRHIEYLSQGLYWNLAKRGMLPVSLHDYLAYLVVILSAGLLLFIFRLKKAPPGLNLTCTALFLFSSPVFMVVCWNYRNGKYLSLFWILLLVWILEKSRFTLTARYTAAFVFFTLMGIFTDAAFVVVLPFILLALCWEKRNVRVLVLGILSFIMGAVGVYVVNQLIGPQFNTGSQFIFNRMIHKPSHLLAGANFFYSWELMPDLIIPQLNFKGLAKFVGILGLLGFLVIALRTRFKHFPYVTAFIITLPVFTFLVRPQYDIGYYSGYYGIMAFGLFVLAIFEVALYFYHTNNVRSFMVSLLVIVGLVVCHQIQKRSVWYTWSDIHWHHSKDQFVDDLKLIEEINYRLAENQNLPININWDDSQISRVNFNAGFGPPHGDSKHTSIAYTLLPILFGRAIKEEQLIIKTVKSP